MTADGNGERLGSLLVRRRIELDRRYRNRQIFAREREIDYRIVSDIERGRRANFETQTIALIERAYDLDAGAIERGLRGGDLILAADRATSPGDELIAMRTRVPRWADRAAFATDTGLGWQLAEQAETGDWSALTPQQRAAVERAYGLGPGGLDRLAGASPDGAGGMAALEALRKELAEFRAEMARSVTAAPPPAGNGGQREAS